MTRVRREQSVEFVCGSMCDHTADSTWIVDGRFDAEGRFEPFDEDDTVCPVCGDVGDPFDDQVLTTQRP